MTPLQQGDRLVFPTYETQIVDSFSFKKTDTGETHEYLVLKDVLEDGTERKWQCDREGFEYMFVSSHHQDLPTVLRDGDVILEGE